MQRSFSRELLNRALVLRYSITTKDRSTMIIILMFSFDFLTITCLIERAMTRIRTSSSLSFLAIIIKREKCSEFRTINTSYYYYPQRPIHKLSAIIVELHVVFRFNFSLSPQNVPPPGLRAPDQDNIAERRPEGILAIHLLPFPRYKTQTSQLSF